MAAWDWLSIVCIVLASITTMLHSLGIRCLLKTRGSWTIRRNSELLSVSFSFICVSLFSTIRISLQIEAPSKIPFGLVVGFLIPLYSGMILLTLQRFFAIWLHLRYESSWIYCKRLHLVACSWLIGVTYIVITLTLYFMGLTNSPMWLLIVKFIPISGIFTTNVTFFSVYTYIFIKYRRAKQGIRNSLYNNRRAKIFTPFIICFSFFTFGTIPHAFRAILPELVHYSFLWLSLDGISSSVVYIFMKNGLMKYLKRFKKNRASVRSLNTASEVTSTAF